jgi:hypothetical protein
VPPSVDVKLHQEMAYLKHYPAKIAFYCHQPAASGGETIIGGPPATSRPVTRNVRTTCG